MAKEKLKKKTAALDKTTSSTGSKVKDEDDSDVMDIVTHVLSLGGTKVKAHKGIF